MGFFKALFLAQILKEAENSVIHNELGANMPNGIATAVALGLYKILKEDPVQRIDNYVIECDEAYLSTLFKEMKFDYLLVTNLFRDQLDILPLLRFELKCLPLLFFHLYRLSQSNYLWHILWHQSENLYNFVLKFFQENLFLQNQIFSKESKFYEYFSKLY